MLILAAVARDDEIVLTSPAPAAAQLRAPSTEPSTAMDIFLIRPVSSGCCWCSSPHVGETLRMAHVGRTQAPVALGIRTQPVIENDYTA